MGSAAVPEEEVEVAAVTATAGASVPAGRAAAGCYGQLPREEEEAEALEKLALQSGRWTRRAVPLALSVLAVLSLLLCGGASTAAAVRQRQQTQRATVVPEGFPLESKVAVAEPFTCAKYGCLDVRSNNACQCSHWCLKEGNCCPDFQAYCAPAASRGRLGVWAGCAPLAPPPPPPGGWAYVAHGAPLTVKVLSYNPEWWHVIEQMGGNGNSIAKVITQASLGQPFDFIGFQEFYDPWYGLSRPGFDASWLLNRYMFIRGEVGGPVGSVIGFKNSSWALLGRGQRFVAKDRKGPMYFGKRIAFWARFMHRQTRKTVLFVNHHGPLPSNTGGVCGGPATANRLLHLIAESAKPGDAIIFVGDFNANVASATISQIAAKLHRCFGGIDNIFTNLPVVNQGQLPSGGSDHAGIMAVLQLPGVGGQAAAPAPAAQAYPAGCCDSAVPPAAWEAAEGTWVSELPWDHTLLRFRELASHVHFCPIALAPAAEHDFCKPE
eukprot:CAMPEP_0179111748 /NCGR_PEP_ID=MMETSP0796-20121207/52208_1 /TAXON_ID=73915 /ORGANISM="Pyrodinium bahamense, Strain pbaha01" /LENGTH=492 /DNA_ID=CAMNT_0020809905 /DNA_START=34 /DNA_END=1510 /DNA_ORIENTATION=-